MFSALILTQKRYLRYELSARIKTVEISLMQLFWFESQLNEAQRNSIRFVSRMKQDSTNKNL